MPLTDAAILREPKVTVLARPQFTEPSHLPVQWIGDSTDGERLSEFAGRLCYMSQRNPAGRTTREYLENIKKQGHGSVLEHANYSLLLEGVSRSLTHELVRHRAGFAYSQLSQRYVDESDAQFVMPPAMIGDAPLEEVIRSKTADVGSTGDHPGALGGAQEVGAGVEPTTDFVTASKYMPSLDAGDPIVKAKILKSAIDSH